MGLKITNPQYNANGTIDCDWKHPVHGLVRFTADPYDVEPHGREVYRRLVAETYGPVAPYEPSEAGEGD